MTTRFRMENEGGAGDGAFDAAGHGRGVSARDGVVADLAPSPGDVSGEPLVSDTDTLPIAGGPGHGDTAVPAPGVLIIGAGLIGTSIGLALTAAGRPVYVTDAVRSHALVAEGLGAGVVETPPPGSVGLVVVAVPPHHIGATVARALRLFPQATVTDVGSVKGAVLADVQARSGDLARYVGSHPMAGSHRSGPLTARADLFVDRTWVIAPHPEADPRRIDDVRKLALSCGARVEVFAPEEHDIAVAEVSHLPQIMSSLVGGRLAEVPREHLRLAGQGARDVTRIAASDPDLWEQIVVANQGPVRRELRAVYAALGALIDHLDDPASVHDFIDHGRNGTRALPGKHGRTGDDYVDVVVEIPDAPGSLARLFADVGAAGINVEDLRIEHDEDREVGYLAIAVTPDRAGVLSDTMVAAGWRIRA